LACQKNETALKEVKINANNISSQGLIPIFNSLAPKIVKNSKVCPFTHLLKLEMS
jgi:hypothetical protein